MCQPLPLDCVGFEKVVPLRFKTRAIAAASIAINLVQAVVRLQCRVRNPNFFKALIGSDDHDVRTLAPFEPASNGATR
jgi:hypothetical protein